MSSAWVRLAGILLCLASAGVANAQHAVILVRHAEKETDPTLLRGVRDLQVPLSAAGQARARALAHTLHESGVGAILTSEALRTQQTADPLAKSLGLATKIFKVTDASLARLGEDLREKHGDQVVVIVGHSNTVPKIADQLMGKPSGIAIGEAEFDRILILVPKSNGSWGLIPSRY